jgi:hypothetical protein
VERRLDPPLRAELRAALAELDALGRGLYPPAVLRADAGPDGLTLEISDDGRGGATLARRLRGIADRVDALGGALTVDSPPGGPTRLRAELPHQ